MRSRKIYKKKRRYQIQEDLEKKWKTRTIGKYIPGPRYHRICSSTRKKRRTCE